METKIRPSDCRKPDWFISASVGKSNSFGESYRHLEITLHHSSSWSKFGSNDERIATFKWQSDSRNTSWYGMRVELESSEMALIVPILVKLQKDVPYLGNTSSVKQVLRSLKRHTKARRFTYDKNTYRYLPKAYANNSERFWSVCDAIAV